MPTVSKRFSFKNLKRRLTGDNNDASERSRTPSPSRFGRNKITETSSASNETGIRLGVTQKETLTLVPPHAAIDMPSPQLYLSPPTPLDPIANLAATGIMDRIHEGPTSSKTEKVLNRIDDMATTVQDPNGLVVTVVQPIKALLESSGAMKAIEEGINTFMEDIPWLMKGLDEIARIHPVVTVAVLAFKTVYKMEMTRRENDRRIQALYVEMKDMMAVLIQLRDVHDRNDVGPDGKTIEARLQGLVGKTATDIKECANACDTYSKKRLLVKILRGQSWETKLVGFAGVFTQRRVQFEQALTMHTARVVDAIHEDVHYMKHAMDAANAKLQMIFDTLLPQDLASLKRKVIAKGDINILMSSNTTLRELNEEENFLSWHQSNEHTKRRSEFTLDDLKEELRLDFDVSLKVNFEAFEGKFNLYYRQLKDDLSKTIEEGNNRVINAVREGPHDKIKNEELKTIWKEMGWRRNVKARLFVMTLRDHFREKVQEIKLDTTAQSSKEQHRTDDWALDYISVTWLQPIMEAFDDDGSGYVTIAEINQFTDSMPRDLGWSLQHWIAYWAVGWRYATAQYIEKINRVIDKMNALRSRVLPENRSRVEYYLERVMMYLINITAGFAQEEIPESLQSKFKPFIDYEEARIRQNLQDIRYDFDALDPVYVVAGPGRIEKYAMPLIYLLLDRDLKIFRVAQHKLLSDDELWDSAESLLWVYDTIALRSNDLRDLYKQQKEDGPTRFKSVAGGLFRYVYNGQELWASPSIFEKRFPRDVTNLETDGSLLELEKVLNKPLRTDSPYKTMGYETPEIFEFVSGASNTNILFGQWNGFLYSTLEYPRVEQAMSSFTFQADPNDKQTIRGSGIDVDGLLYTIKGKYFVSDSGTTEVEFALFYEGGDPTKYFKGHLEENGSLVGLHGYMEDVSKENYACLFILRNVPAEIMACRPGPAYFVENKPRALWKFARDAILTQTRRELFSWSYFEERRNRRRQYIKYGIRYWCYGRRLDKDESAQFLASQRQILPADGLYYLSLRKHILAIMPCHFDCTCDVCSRALGGSRIICADCHSSRWDTVDFCGDSTCHTHSVTRSDLKSDHLPTHSFVKIRTNIQWHDIKKLRQNAATVLERWRRHPVSTPEMPLNNNDNDKLPVPEESPVKFIHCFVCQTSLTKAFWYCAECADCAICETCEINTLLSCLACKRPFEQPSWYYESQPNDEFLYSTCTAKGVKPPANTIKGLTHTYLHSLVWCQDRLEGPVEPSLTTELARSTLISLLHGLPPLLHGRDSTQLAPIQEALTSLQQLMTTLQLTQDVEKESL